MADISGSWLGTYWQLGIPTRFEATLVQTGNALVGNILDNGYLGEAQVSGEVIGRSVRFTKQYLNKSHYKIIYTGILSESEDFMQGKWRIGFLQSGKWEARRSGEDLLASLKARQASQVPVGVT